MSRPTDVRPSETSDDPRKIGKWTRAYAQNRSLGMVVMVAINVALYIAIGVPSYLGGYAYREGQWFVLWLCIAIVAVAMMATFYLAMPWWGGKLAERIVMRLYAEEGRVEICPPPSRRRRWIGVLLGVTFGTCIVALVAIGILYDMPEKYMQPISALYMVPFLVGLWLLMRPAIGPILLLWPLLYAIHAVLIVAGVPIAFVSSPWNSLNMLIPVAGYGLLTGLLSHLYSRLALRRLRRAARGDLPDQMDDDPTAEERQS